MTIFVLSAIMMLPRKGPEGYCYIKRRLAHFLANLIREGVVLMGSGRWTKVLRYVVWAIVAFALMVATAQKAC